MPLAAFGVYNGEVREALPNGRVNIALYRFKTYFVDLELSNVEISATRETMRPGTCLLVDAHS